MTLANFTAYMAQMAFVVIACAGIPRLLGLRSPMVQYLFWRIVLIVCLALPLLQPWPPRVVPDSASSISVSAPAAPRAATVPVTPAGTPERSLPFEIVSAGALVLAAGCMFRLVWLLAGIARVYRLRRAPGTEIAEGFDDLREAIGTETPIHWSPHVRHPVTCGVRRPVVLLPVALKAVDRGAQRAVVAHELHHVRRRDWAWLIGEEVLRAVFWFHPAMWWLISRVQLARETVVDELSILVTNSRRTYLDALLAFADDSAISPSPAFSARRHLFHRVMLLSKEAEMSSLRVAVGSGVLIVALGAGTLGAASAFPLYTEQAAPAQTPPRDPKTPPRDRVPALTYHREAVELWETSRDPSLTSEQRLELARQGIALEDKALAINPDYVDALTYKNIFLRVEANLTPEAARQRELMDQANALRNRAIEIRKTQPYVQRAGEPPPPPPPPPPMLVTAADGTTTVVVPSPAAPMVAPVPEAYRREIEARQPLRVGGNVKSPVKIRDVKPTYPPEAQAARVEGVVIVEILIDTDGEVVDARILRKIPLLDDAALDAVRQWRFAPTIVDGEPRAVLMTVTVNFRVSQGD